MDYPARFLGRKHRILFHDPLSAVLIGILCDGRNGVYSAFIHLALDKYSDNEFVKRFLEYL